MFCFLTCLSCDQNIMLQKLIVYRKFIYYEFDTNGGLVYTILHAKKHNIHKFIYTLTGIYFNSYEKAFPTNQVQKMQHA